MPRYVRNMAVMAGVEATAGVAATLSAASNGLLITGAIDVTPLEITYAQRNLLLPYFGGSQDLIASINTKIGFSVELAGSGTAGTAAAWSVLLQGCGMAQASSTTPTRVEHTPVSASLKTLTIEIYDDGVMHRLTGAMGNAKFSFKKNETPKIMFEFVGAYAPPTAVSVPALTLTAWKAPLPMARANVVDITLGCTYAAGALAGGTVFPSNGIEIDLGNKTSFFSTLSSERAELTDRAATCSFEMELTAAQEVAAMADMVSNATIGMGFTVGSAAGAKLLVYAPSLARKTPKKVDSEGIRLIGFDGQLLPISGNDEIRLVQL